jgi:hypothetical protein
VEQLNLSNVPESLLCNTALSNDEKLENLFLQVILLPNPHKKTVPAPVKVALLNVMVCIEAIFQNTRQRFTNVTPSIGGVLL